MRLREREYQEVAKDANLQVVRHAANFIPYFGPVQTNPIMANVKVRQALAYAVPYDEIRQKVYLGQGQQIKSITPKIFPNYTDQFWPYKTDLDKARALLRDAGFPKGFDMTISYDKAIPEMEEACILIKSSFDKIGLKTKLVAVSSFGRPRSHSKREISWRSKTAISPSRISVGGSSPATTAASPASPAASRRACRGGRHPAY